MHNIFFVAFLLLFFPVFPAAAYLDPGTGSMLVQILAIGFGGVLFLLKLYGRKMISFFKRIFTFKK